MIDLALDMRTLALLAMLSAIVQGVSLTALWLAVPGAAGPRHWAAGGGLLAAGLVLLALRGQVPDSLSIMLSNFCLVASHAAFLCGVDAYNGRPASLRFSAGLVGASLLGLAYFAWVEPDIAARIVIFSVPVALFGAVTAWRLAVRPPELRSPAELWMAGLFALHAGFHAFRGLVVLVTAPEIDSYFEVSQVSYLHVLVLFEAIFFAFAIGIGFTVMTTVTLNRSLQRQLETRSQLFSVLAHDLRSPVAGLVTLASLVELKAGQGDTSDLSKYAGLASADARQLLSLLDDLLVWGKAEFAGRGALVERLDLQELVDSACAPLATAAENKDIKIRQDLEVGAAVGVRMHAQTVLRNLLSNAVKFSPPGSEVLVSAFAEGKSVVVSVADRGIGLGVAPRKGAVRLDRVKKQSGTAGEKSGGLGLLICEDLCRGDGERIWLVANPGGGTVGSFTLAAVAQ